jgi:hypothetical protein
MSDYATAEKYSIDYKRRRPEAQRSYADDAFVARFVAQRDVVLFDLLDTGNVELLRERFKDDDDMLYKISYVTGAGFVEKNPNYENGSMTRFTLPAHVAALKADDLNPKYVGENKWGPIPKQYNDELKESLINDMELTDACGRSHTSGLTGLSRSSSKDYDVAVLNAIRVMCEELGVDVDGWHQSETLSLTTGHFNPEIVLFSCSEKDGIMTMDCSKPQQGGASRGASVATMLVLAAVTIAASFS